MFDNLDREYTKEEKIQGEKYYKEALQLLDDEEDFDKIMALLMKAVDSGNPDAAYLLADWYNDDPFDEGYSKELAYRLAKFAYDRGVIEAKEILK